jgi:nucleotide-binding universal stress UspA family protein
MYKHLLIPTDGSKVADKAVSAGIEFARGAGAKVTLFTAVPEFRFPSEGEVMARRPVISMDEHARRSQKKAHKVLLPGVARAGVAGVACDIDYVQSDHPSQAIIDAARRHGCDAIFMATHGRKGLSRLIHGSETLAVLTDSDIPTVVVR